MLLGNFPNQLQKTDASDEGNFLLYILSCVDDSENSAYQNKDAPESSENRNYRKKSEKIYYKSLIKVELGTFLISCEESDEEADPCDVGKDAGSCLGYL